MKMECYQIWCCNFDYRPALSRLLTAKELHIWCSNFYISKSLFGSTTFKYYLFCLWGKLQHAFSAFFVIIFMAGFFYTFFMQVIIQWIPSEKFISSTFSSLCWVYCTLCFCVGSQEFIFTNFHFRKRSVTLRHNSSNTTYIVTYSYKMLVFVNYIVKVILY